MKWRILELEEMDPHFALALEEIAQRSVGEGGDPIIRFWKWKERAVTVGSFQNVEDEVYTKRCKEQGIPIIRRISGGGTMYHEPEKEFIFSIIAPPGILSRDIRESYRQVLGPIKDGLKRIGIDSVIEDNNLMVDGRKLSGSSQRRGAKAIINHGTLLYDADQDTMLRYIRGDKVIPSGKGTCSQYRPVTSVLENVNVSFDEVYQGIKEALIERKEHHIYNWTDGEINEAEELVRTKYRDDKWNMKI